jgi:hypothetical protein
MHIAINSAYQFRDEFHRADRQTQFSYEGLGLLFEYLEKIDPDYNLDVVGLCCDYSEGTPLEILENYGVKLNEEEKEDAIPVAVAYLEDRTSIVGMTASGSIIYQQF